MCPAHAWSRVTTFGSVKHSRGKQKKKRTLPFSDQTPAFPMYWPVYYFCPPFQLFFFFLSHAASNPSSSLSSPLLFSPLLTPLWLVGPFSPAILSPRPPPIHALCLNQNKCSSSDRLAPINCLDPCSMTTSPFYGKPPSVMDDLFISALPRLFSLPVLRCLLFSPSKDGYAPKSVYPLRYVIVSNLPLFCLSIVNLISVVLFSISFIILRVSY